MYHDDLYRDDPSFDLYHEGTRTYIAFRGTSSIPDLFTDLELAFGSGIPDEFDRIFRAVRARIQTERDNGTLRSEVIFTGHSLGAFYAGVIFAILHGRSFFTNMTSYAIVFESPGGTNFLQRFIRGRYSSESTIGNRILTAFRQQVYRYDSYHPNIVNTVARFFFGEEGMMQPIFSLGRIETR